MIKKPEIEYDIEKKSLISEFNEAKFRIFRLHNLFQDCNSYSCIGNLYGWKWKLDTIWRELSSSAKKKADDEYFNKIKKLNKNIQESESDSAKLYETLSKKEIFLRQLQDDVGMGSKWKPEDEDMMD